MIKRYVVITESPQLKYSGEVALNLISLFSISRYIFILAGLVGFVSPDIMDVFFCATGAVIHFIIRPYCGFSSELKCIQGEQDFIPLHKWMIKNNDMEFLDSENEDVMNGFSLLAQGKMKEIVKTQKKPSVYDAVNLLLLDMQYGRRAEWQIKNDECNSH